MQLSNERINLLKDFCAKNNLKVRNFELLNRAFCHTSYIHENKLNRIESYEQLEFLGDAVLKLAVSAILLKEFPNEMEGELTKRRAMAVSDKINAFFAQKLNFDDLILIGKCESGQKKESLFACSFEALLGVIYLELGYSEAEKFILAFKEEILNVDYLNPKSLLQEFTQKNNHDLPKYVLLDEMGPAHDKTFIIGVYYQGKLIGTGEAKSHKNAEFMAAQAALKKLNGDIKNAE